MNKKILIIIIAILLLSGGIGFFIIKEVNKVKIVKKSEDKYVAYVKINPSVKLDYSRKCIEYSNKKIECEEPIVYEYELVNEDAKEIFKDVNLLEGSKDLYSVINNIVDNASKKGIEVKDVEIKSDWKEINTYIETKNEEKIKENNETNNQTNNEVNNNENTNKNNTEINNNENNQTNNEQPKEEKTSPITINVNVQEEEQITNEITTEKEEEAKKKAEEEAKKKAEEEARIKAEEEAKKKAEEEAKKKAAQTIYLKDNVKYDHNMSTYTCDNCFSTSLINTIKKAKGYKLIKGSSSEITYAKINKLSGKYNSTTYFGSSLSKKITNAGGIESGGAGGSGDDLTKSVCSEYHLTCE